jgi:hypothetical protein
MDDCAGVQNCAGLEFATQRPPPIRDGERCGGSFFYYTVTHRNLDSESPNASFHFRPGRYLDGNPSGGSALGKWGSPSADRLSPDVRPGSRCPASAPSLSPALSAPSSPPTSPSPPPRAPYPSVIRADRLGGNPEDKLTTSRSYGAPHTRPLTAALGQQTSRSFGLGR